MFTLLAASFLCASKWHKKLKWHFQTENNKLSSFISPVDHASFTDESWSQASTAATQNTQVHASQLWEQSTINTLRFSRGTRVSNNRVLCGFDLWRKNFWTVLAHVFKCSELREIVFVMVIWDFCWKFDWRLSLIFFFFVAVSSW